MTEDSTSLTVEEKAWLSIECEKYDHSYNIDDVLFAYRRLARIFSRSLVDVHAEQEFGKELPASFRSFLKRNEMDQVRLDLEDLEVQLVPELKIDYVEAITVRGYVSAMARAAILARKYLHRGLPELLGRVG